MVKTLTAKPLTADDFAAYGDVIELRGEPTKMINEGMCGRHHDLAKLEFIDGRAGISLFDAQARHLPYAIPMVERHPQGSQAFMPLSPVPFLVVVADDDAGKPVNLQAFITARQQQGFKTKSINLALGVVRRILNLVANARKSRT